jgi:hypothetical protein
VSCASRASAGRCTSRRRSSATCSRSTGRGWRRPDRVGVEDGRCEVQFPCPVADTDVPPAPCSHTRRRSTSGSPRAASRSYRVERTNGTLQDWLVKELRLRGLNDPVAVTPFLLDFMTDYHHRFAKPLPWRTTHTGRGGPRTSATSRRAVHAPGAAPDQSPAHRALRARPRRT